MNILKKLPWRARRPQVAPAAAPSIEAPIADTPAEVAARYLRDTPSGRRGVNLGCGRATFSDLLNIDSQPHDSVNIVWDLTKGLPFLPSDQFDAVTSEHFFE